MRTFTVVANKPKVCPKCKHLNASNYTYCYECGAYLGYRK